MKKKNLKGKLILNKKTVSHLSQVAMNDVHGRTGEACESMLLSCNPKKYLCDTSDFICVPTLGIECITLP